MKIIFLDFDGTMTSRDYQTQLIESQQKTCDRYGELFATSCIENLKKIIDATGADIVISSDWKKFMTYKDILEMWEYRNLPGFVTDTTPNTDEIRGEEIDMWLTECKNSVQFVILDDMGACNFKQEQIPYFVNCHPQYGITEEVVNKAISILNK